MHSFAPILILFLIAAGLAGTLLLLASITGQKRPNRKKLEVFECGSHPVGTARERFPVKFYLVAILFIVFDLEVVFLYPWVIMVRDLGFFGFFEMTFFLGVLLVGLYYIWKKGALEWD